MELRIERLTPARRDDYLRFFDHERGPAFADNPEWATCYCHYYQVPKSIRDTGKAVWPNDVAFIGCPFPWSACDRTPSPPLVPLAIP